MDSEPFLRETLRLCSISPRSVGSAGRRGWIYWTRSYKARAAVYNIRAFFTKLVLWKTQLSQTNLCYFPACKALMDAVRHHCTFADFQETQTLFKFTLTSSPPTCKRRLSPELQMGLTDLPDISELKAKLREVSGKADERTGFNLPWAFQLVQTDHVPFWEHFTCEKLFSSMNFNKVKVQVQIYWWASSTASSLKPDVDRRTVYVQRNRLS